MNHFVINTFPSADRSLCFLNYPPDGTANYSHRMAMGHAMGDKYPHNAKLYLDKKSPGTRLASLLGNTGSYLVVERALKDVFEATKVPMECLPFTLYDHKKKVLTRDYFIINPLGTFDCVDRKKSKIEFDGDDVVSIDKLVLDPKKMKNAPDIFRIPEEPQEYFVSQGLARKLQALKPTNFFLKDVDKLVVTRSPCPPPRSRWLKSPPASSSRTCSRSPSPAARPLARCTSSGTMLRRMAIAQLLLTGMPDDFFAFLDMSARSWLEVLSRKSDDEKVTSLSGAFFDAVACKDDDAARGIVAHSRATWNRDEEYEDDFLYVWSAMALFDGRAQGELASLAERFEKAAVDGDRRVALIRALVDRDQKAFDDALAAVVQERQAELREEESPPSACTRTTCRPRRRSGSSCSRSCASPSSGGCAASASIPSRLRWRGSSPAPTSPIPRPGRASRATGSWADRCGLRSPESEWSPRWAMARSAPAMAFAPG